MERSGAEDGAFVICSYWLAECLARAGEVDRARAVFDRVTAHANDLGLLAEQIDTETGELLSNFPQTFSHAGLINAAWAIDRAATKVEVRCMFPRVWCGAPPTSSRRSGTASGWLEIWGWTCAGSRMPGTSPRRTIRR